MKMLAKKLVIASLLQLYRLFLVKSSLNRSAVTMKHIFTFVLTCCSILTFGQNTRTRDTTKLLRERVLIGIAGGVTDAVTGQPLPGASISFTDARIGAMANKSG